MKSVSQIVLTGLALLVGCSDSADPVEQEVIAALFKPRGRQVGEVVVTARQGGKEKSVTLGAEAFADCQSNRVRILPRKLDGSFPDLTLSAASQGGALSSSSVTLSFPRATPAPIDLVLRGEGGATDLEPTGPCTPRASKDAGNDVATPDGGPGDDAAPPKRKTGEPCSNENACEGGLCIASFTRDSIRIELPGNYCSRDCSDDEQCPAGSSCELQTSAAGGDLGWRCLQSCSTTNPCLRAGYTCKGGNICLP